MHTQNLAATIAFPAGGMGLAGEDSAKADRPQYLPLAGHETATFSEQTIESRTLGLGLMRGRDEVAPPGERDSLLAVATYRQESCFPR